ncbi:hypothetical protein ACX16J_29160 [Bacillus cereus]
MKKKIYKKLVPIIPLTCLLSSPILVSPVTTFAAETTTNTTTQTNFIKGYVLKNGVKTPIYENTKVSNLSSGPISPEFPTLSSNPLDGLPKEGSSITELGSIGDIMYFDGYWGGNEQTGKNFNIYIAKLTNGDIEYGGYDPETGELYTKKTVLDTPQEKQKRQAELNQLYGPLFDGTTKLERKTQYKLLESSILDNSAQYSFNKSVKHGVSKTNMFSFAATAGFKISTKAGIPGLGEVASEFSESLTATYGHTITVTQENSTATTFGVGKVDNPAYLYKQYTTGVYQLKSTYTVIPGTGLQQILQAHKELKGLAKTVYQYDEDQLYFGVTPGSHL